jgi:hypothetical protein
MSVGADKADDTPGLCHDYTGDGNSPARDAEHQAPGGSAIVNRTTRYATYEVSQRKWPWIEKVFAWMKQTGSMRKTKLRGLAKGGLAVPHDCRCIQPSAAPETPISRSVTE